MDQKNTIVKCNAHPNCLSNHNGVCDNYVINIGADGKCEGYVEAEVLEYLIRDPVKTGLAFKKIFRQIDIERGQRANCNFYEDTCSEEFLRDQMCWYCDHGRSGHCGLTAKPTLDSNGKCCRFISTGGNR